MSKLIKIVIVTMSATILVAFLGCSIAMDAITPCPIQPDAAEYADEPLMDFLPFSTLHDAKRIRAKMNYVHETNQKMFARLAEDDVDEYGFLNDIHTSNIEGALAFQETVFSTNGLGLGAIIPGLGGLGLGWLGISKPDDKRKIAKLENGG
jgi:hypothetical protein